MSQERFIRTLALAIAGLFAAKPAGASPPPPPTLPVEPSPLNVLLIVADDIGVDQIGEYARAYNTQSNSSWPTPCTPAIDDLAAHGMRFTNAWSNPVCSPTRSLIMTGKRTDQTGIGIALPPDADHTENPGLNPAFFGLPRLAPGRNSAVGKWHLADNDQLSCHPIELGFSKFGGVLYNFADQSMDGPSYVNWYRRAAFQDESGDCVELPVEPFAPNPDTPYYATAVTTEAARAELDRLEGESSGAPWLLYVAYNASHTPNHCPVHENAAPPYSECAPEWWSVCDAQSEFEPATYQTRAMTQSLDYEIGRLLEGVNWETTAVIFIGDNGTPNPATDPPFDNTHGKMTVYQGGINVPLIIRTPCCYQGAVCNELVSATDLFATVADLLGAAPPPDPDRDSISLAPYLNRLYTTPTWAKRQLVYAERFSPTFEPVNVGNGGPPAGYLATFHDRAIRNATHKMIEKRSPAGIKVELYRLFEAGVNEPAPQDPAVLDRLPSEQDDDLASAFEPLAADLMQRAATDWTAEDEAACDALSAELRLNQKYRPLPLYVFDAGARLAAPSGVRSVMQTEGAPLCGPDGPPEGECHDAAIHVGHADEAGAVTTERSFLRFDTSLLEFHLGGAEPFSVTLEVGVLGGASAPNTAVEVRAVDLATCGGCFEATDPCECGRLYESVRLDVDGLYGTASGWDGSTPFTKSIPLNGSGNHIIADLEAAIPTGSFVLALKLQGDESVADAIELSPLRCGPDSHHRLHVTFRDLTGGDLEVILDPIRSPEGVAPATTRTAQNVPNPFNPSTTVRYAVAKRGAVSLRIYNAAGALVRTLVEEVQEPGDGYAAVWDGRDGSGQRVPSGVYYYRLAVGELSQTRKMLLLK